LDGEAAPGRKSGSHAAFSLPDPDLSREELQVWSTQADQQALRQHIRQELRFYYENFTNSKCFPKGDKEKDFDKFVESVRTLVTGAKETQRKAMPKGIRTTEPLYTRCPTMKADRKWMEIYNKVDLAAENASIPSRQALFQLSEPNPLMTGPSKPCPYEATGRALLTNVPTGEEETAEQADPDRLWQEANFPFSACEDKHVMRIWNGFLKNPFPSKFYLGTLHVFLLEHGNLGHVNGPRASKKPPARYLVVYVTPDESLSPGSTDHADQGYIEDFCKTLEARCPYAPSNATKESMTSRSRSSEVASTSGCMTDSRRTASVPKSRNGIPRN